MSKQSSSWVGQKLSGGRYRVESLLGEGGMGHVYRARDNNLDADVVIKVPRRAMVEDPGFVGRFEHEVRSLVRLSHPHIVKVTDVGTHDGLPFAVMQYLPGGNLEDRRPLGPAGEPVPANPASLEAWLPDIAAALDYVHAKGYVHRDVKPANILFDAEGHAFLSDFGVTKALASGGEGRSRATTAAGLVLGTPEYMAPELIMGEAFDGRADQYALAITVYELLAGKRPFDGPTTAALLVQQTTKEPPYLGTLRLGINERLTAAVHRGVAKEPGQRFSDSVAFAREVISGSLTQTTHARTRSTVSTERLKTFPKSKSAQNSSAAAQSVSDRSEIQDTSQPDADIFSEKNGTTKRFLGDRRRSTNVVFVVLVAVAGLGGLIRYGVVNKIKVVNLQIKKTLILKRSDEQVPRNASKVTAPVAPALTVSETPGTDKRPKEEVRGVGLEKKDSPPTLMEIKDLAVDANTPIDFTATLSTPRYAGDVAYSLVNPPAGAVIHEKSGRFTWKPAVTQAGKTHGIVIKVVSLESKESTSEKTFKIQVNPYTGEIRRFIGHEGGISGIAISPDGRLAMSGGEDRTIRLWDTATGKELKTERFKTTKRHIVFSKDSEFVALSDGTVASIYKTDLTEEIERFPTSSLMITDSALSDDGRVALACTGGTVLQSFDTKTGNRLAYLEGHTGQIRCICLSPEGGTALSGGEDKVVRLWDTNSGKELRRLQGHAAQVQCVTFSRDGRLVLSGGEDKTVRLWDVETGRELKRFVCQGAVFGLAIAGDIAFAVVSGGGGGGVEVEMGNVVRGKLSKFDIKEPFQQTELDIETAIDSDRETAIDSDRRFKFYDIKNTIFSWYSSDYNMLSNVHQRRVNILEMSSGKKWKISCGTLNRFALFADDHDQPTSLLAADGGSLCLWSVSQKRPPVRFRYGTSPPLRDIRTLSTSQKGNLVLSGDNDGTLSLWDIDKKMWIKNLCTHPKNKKDSIISQFFHSEIYHKEHQYIIAFNGFYTLGIVVLVRDVEIFKFQIHYPISLNSINKYILYVDRDNALRLVDPEHGREVNRFQGHAGKVLALAQTTDGRYAVSGGEDSTLRLWDLHSGRELQKFENHTGPIRYVALSSDGRRILSGGDDNLLRLWTYEGTE